LIRLPLKQRQKQKESFRTSLLVKQWACSRQFAPPRRLVRQPRRIFVRRLITLYRALHNSWHSKTSKPK
ncbi:MAG: hypothetical protein AAB737_01205, partial [Patescibacteria group bacterium]